ncbi:MAG: hypothetical protein QOE45_1155 [Frankiaceae bacterium]|jgi:uncharacterized membrane protein YgcG|nr:hypothetical protein [Frankiaceae bacterium]
MPRVLPVLAAVAIATGAVVLAPANSAPPPVIQFGVPRIADPIHVYGEPDIAVSPNGTMHVSGPQGTGVQRSIWNISVDGGDSYRNVNDLEFNTGTPVDEACTGCPGKATLGPGGGDTEIYVTRNGRAFYNDLWALACFTAGTTADDGKTVDSNANGCSQQGLANADRQWMAAFDPAVSDKTVSPYTGPTPLVYMAYNGPQVDMTTDGLDYSRSAGQFKGNTGANVIVDQHTGKFLTVTHVGNALQLAIGTPDADGKLAFDYHDATDARDGSPGLLFPIVTQDTDRNVYIVWTEDDNYQVYYTSASAADGWTKWAPVRQISKPPATTNVFSWAAAAGPGMLDVAWYGTSEDIKPDDQNDQKWDLYFAQVDHAQTHAPHIVQVKAAPHPMHYDDICLAGTGCIASVGNRNLADFFKIVIDNDGRARIVYADTSNRLMDLGRDAPEGADHAGAPVDTVVTQSTGLNAWTGKPLAPLESTEPISGVSDDLGDARLKPLGGTSLSSADILEATMETSGENLVIKVHLAEGRLSDVATAANLPAAQLVVRWQVAGTPTTGDPIYYAQVEELATGTDSFASAGPARTVDLCSVSACKPNYVVYPSVPAATAVTSTFADQTYTITVPFSVIGSPTGSTVFESVEAHIAAEPKSASVPDTKVEHFPDEVPVVIEATRTWNYRRGATGLGDPVPLFPAVQRAGCSISGSTGGSAAGNDGSLAACAAGVASGGGGTGGSGGGSGPGSGSGGGGTIPTTGIPAALPVAAATVTGAVAVLLRRRRRAA